MYINGEEVNEENDVQAFMNLFPNAKGIILMGGLGLGRDLLYLLSKPEVEKVTVIEIVPEVIDWFSYNILPKHDLDLDRFEIQEGNFFSCLPFKGEYDLIIDTVGTIREVG